MSVGRRLLPGLLVVALGLGLVGCGKGSSPSGAPPQGGAQARTSTVAQATTSQVGIFERAGASAPQRTLKNPQPSGAPLVFLVQQQEGAWLHVLLPVRPNGSTGWIRRSDVSLFQHDYRIVIELTAHRITVYKGDSVFLQEPVGVGTKDTPTPGGVYYIKELLKPTDERGRYIPSGVYGPYAYGLSGFSDVLPNFAGGEGVIGLHGTNDPTSIGRDVSHGCIRMSNAGITRLAKTLPLGVPVEIRR